MSWVGKASSDPRVMVVSKKSPFRTLADMQKSDRHEFRAEAQKAKRSVIPLYGDELTKLIRASLAQPPEVVELLKTLVTKAN